MRVCYVLFKAMEGDKASQNEMPRECQKLSKVCKYFKLNHKDKPEHGMSKILVPEQKIAAAYSEHPQSQ